MRFMMLMIPKGYESAKPGTVPEDAKAVAAMMKYNEELSKAGVLIALGLRTGVTVLSEKLGFGAALIAESGGFDGSWIRALLSSSETVGSFCAMYWTCWMTARARVARVARSR